MKINSVTKLSPRTKSAFKAIHNRVKEVVDDNVLAAKVALQLFDKVNVPMSSGMKSMAVAQQSHITGQSSLEGPYVDFMLGLPTVDLHGSFLAESFWQKKPIGVIKGDFDHHYAKKANGIMVDDNPEYEGWVPMAQKFWHDNDGALWARAELPEKHPFTPTFLERWKSGEYGASIEFVYPDEAVEYKFNGDQMIEVIHEGSITGFTFTDDPAILQTKKKK